MTDTQKKTYKNKKKNEIDMLHGMGISIPPMIITIMGSCVFRILWINTAFRMFPRIEVLMMVYSVSWMLISIFMTSLYFKKRKSMLAALAA